MIYETRRLADLSEDLLQQCSELYSKNYGVYSGADNKHKFGERIRMSVSLYRKLYAANKNIFISLCYADNKQLVGQALFLKDKIAMDKQFSWVLQLVVHNRYRKRGIASRLLQSAWGFSDYYGWGLATTNAITIKTLESVTWREITIDDIEKNIQILSQILDKVPYVENSQIVLGQNISQVFTNFYPELEKSNDADELKIYTKCLGKIQDGYEWLAFTFASQKISFNKEKFEKYLEFSEQQLKDAYGRMKMTNQPWTRGTENEIDFIVSKLSHDKKDINILDLGCGLGRHSIALAKRGYENVLGIDFVPNNIKQAKQNALRQEVIPSFIEADIRTFNQGRDYRYDLVLCLYDVIGSFRENDDNRRILRTIKHHLKFGGIAVVSVMNMSYTLKQVKNKLSLSENPTALLKLKSSNTMEESGNVFNPDYYLINEDDGLVYRKEKFSGDENIFAEYVVADKRYNVAEFEAEANAIGLQVIEHRFVKAGHWDVPCKEDEGKEIVFVLALKDRK